MLDAMGKTKVLTSEAAEKCASVDPQHQITADDTKGKGLIQEGTSSGRSPRPGIVITHRRYRETWQQREDRYRHQQEDRRREEERCQHEWNRHKDHWNCPFFIHYWEQNIKLPTVRDCSECNGYNRHDRPNRRYQDDNRRFGGPIRRRTLVHDRFGGRLSVHDRLGEHVGYFPRSQEELEDMADARVPDEFIFCRDANTYLVESRENHHQSVRQPQLPPWCPEGLTRTQKRRLQRERQEELSGAENFAKSGDRQQSDPKGKGLSTNVNMVFMLPMEFLAPFSDDEDMDFPDQIAQLALDPMTAIYEKPTDDERHHLKALSVKGRVDGQPMTKILVDGGAAINIMSYTVYQKLGKQDQDLTKTDMMLKDFEGNLSPDKGAICIELTIGSKTLPTTFFVISGKGAYKLLHSIYNAPMLGSVGR